MYKLEFLPIALNDMVEIVGYIGNTLKKPIAAGNLSSEFVNVAEILSEVPYSNPVYVPLRPLKHEYRKLLVKSYLMFYWVDEEKKVVTVSRVIYGKRDYGKILK
ncbi:MAG: type II toxin-antitoxin system RelE/ParE family toxin [Oscillospiraceae bacterium]|nr:type II toxin-antitoxin system RelE/ParE family toxin [Oscillospiraceae bacterium]MBQ6698053.1 type II toxin-antitoxin system RelE/ParE family toxin [Oscillospiraceae bacterium]